MDSHHVRVGVKLWKTGEIGDNQVCRNNPFLGWGGFGNGKGKTLFDYGTASSYMIETSIEGREGTRAVEQFIYKHDHYVWILHVLKTGYTRLIPFSLFVSCKGWTKSKRDKEISYTRNLHNKVASL